jgi:hypothetical protein
MTMQTAIEKLTHRWCDELRGKDCRIGLGACFNVLTTIGNYAPPDVRSVMVMFLRKIADELDARRDQ